MKRLSLLCAIIITAAVFTGCKASTKPSTVVSVDDGEKNPIEITVVTSYGGDDGNRQSYEKAVKAYEAASGNTVKDHSGISNEEWKAGITADFENGSEPDVLFYFTGVDANKFIENNQIVSIDEIRSVYPDYASNMDENMLPLSPFDGNAYAVPVNGYWEGLYVNKKVLADCGVEVPDADTTWSKFLSDCQKIADKGYIPITASLYEVPHYWFEFCVFNNGSAETHTKLPESSDDIIGRNWAAGLNDIKELYEKGFFPEITLTAVAVETDVLMTENKAAFMIDGSWKMGWFAENASDINNFTVTYVPGKISGKNERKSTDIIGGISMGYFITRKAWDNPEKQAACVEFIEAMTTDEVVVTFGATSVTALKNDITPPADASSLVKDALKMTQNFTDITAATEDGLTPNSRGNLFANVVNIVTGEITAEEAIDLCLKIKD